jgi:hypothetical protein
MTAEEAKIFRIIPDKEARLLEDHYRYTSTKPLMFLAK